MKLLARFMVFVFLINMMSIPSFGVKQETDQHWAGPLIEKWLESDWINGYPDGNFKPDQPITRSEWVTMMQKVYNLYPKKSSEFLDVSKDHWAYEAISGAYEAKIIYGYPDGTFRPNEPITREAAAVILVRVLELPLEIETDQWYRDYDALSEWSVGHVGALYIAGIMTGNPSGEFMPQKAMTRGEALTALHQGLLSQNRYVVAGHYGTAEHPEIITGNVWVQSDGVILDHMTIKGDLVIDTFVGAGDVYLKNITVQGNTFIRGGGANSIHIEGGNYGLIVIENTPSGHVRVIATDVLGATVIVAEAASGDTITFEGYFEAVKVLANDITILTQGTTHIDHLDFQDGLSGNQLIVSEGTLITNMIVSSELTVTGSGDINHVVLKNNAVTFENAPNQIQDDTQAPIVSAPTVVPSPAPEETPVSPAPSPVTVTNIEVLHPVVTLLLEDSNPTYTIVTQLSPDEASLADLTWTSSDETIVTVSEGLLIPVSVGTATIIVAGIEGDAQATVTVDVLAEDAIYGQLSDDFFETVEPISVAMHQFSMNMLSADMQLGPQKRLIVDEVWAIPIIRSSWGLVSEELFLNHIKVPIESNGKFELPLSEMTYDQYVLVLVNSKAEDKRDHIVNFLAIRNPNSARNLIAIPRHDLSRGLRLGLINQINNEALSEIDLVAAAESFNALTFERLLELAETSNTLKALKNYYVNIHPETGEIMRYGIEHWLYFGDVSINEPPYFENQIIDFYAGVGVGVDTNRGDGSQKYFRLPGEMIADGITYSIEQPYPLTNSYNGSSSDGQYHAYTYFTSPSFSGPLVPGEWVLYSDERELGYFDFAMVPLLDQSNQPLGYFPGVHLIVNEHDMIESLAVTWYYNDGVTIRGADDIELLRSSVLGAYFNCRSAQGIPIELNGIYPYKPQVERFVIELSLLIDEAELLLENSEEMDEAALALQEAIDVANDQITDIVEHAYDIKNYAGFSLVVDFIGAKYTYNNRGTYTQVLDLYQQFNQDRDIYTRAFTTHLENYKAYLLSDN